MVSLDRDVLSLKYRWDHPDGEAQQAVGHLEGVLGTDLRLKLNLIIMFIEVIPEILYLNAMVRRECTEQGLNGWWREISAFGKGKNKKEGPSASKHTHPV